MGKRVVIVGGVAGGMSCAARLKRLDDALQVVVFEKGADVSFANCGMPYYIGGVIEDRARMAVQTPAGLGDRYGIDIRTCHEVLRIDRAGRAVEVRNLSSGKVTREPYDFLVLSPGAAPWRPPVPGIDNPNVYVLNDLADMDAIAQATAQARRVCVIGAGFIGLELVENFRRRGLEVCLVEVLDQVLPPLDPEMARPLLDELRRQGVEVRLGGSITSIEAGVVILEEADRIACDFVCMSVGVRPTSGLARDAGLELGDRGHIRVDARMRTSDPRIYAVGDVVEVRDFVTGVRAAVPLAGPANRQGRIAADNICGRDARYRDTQGTAIVKVFDQAAALTGLNEKSLRRAQLEYRRVYIHPTQHPAYYPGAKPMAIKLLFGLDGRILGAQAVAPEGAETFIDVIATAMRGDLTVYDLEHLELAYSPQWGAAKHPVNMAGFVAANLLEGDVEPVEPDADLSAYLLLDTRTEAEVAGGTIPGALHIPVDALRRRVHELPRDKTIAVYCAAGLRGYVGYRYLKQQGFDVRNLNGGYRTWCAFQAK